MKKNIFAALLLSVLTAISIISCDKSDDIATGTPSVTSAGTFSGQIDSLQSGTVDSIKVIGFHFDNDNDIILEFGKCKINGDKFSMQLKTPPTIFLSHSNFLENGTDTSGYQIETYIANLSISDTTMAAFGALQFETYKNGFSNGRIAKTNNALPFTTGFKTSMFLYSDKYYTIKGTAIDKREYNNGSKKYMPYYLEARYNMTLKPGWNEFVETNEKVIETDSTSYVIYSISNIIPTDMTWRWKPTSSYNSPQKRIGAKYRDYQPRFFRNLLK